MLKKLFSAGNINQLYAFMHQLLMAAYGFALLFIMLRLMPQAEVGRWLLFISALSISDMLMQGLLQTIVVKEIATHKADAFINRKIENNALLLATAFFMVMVAVTFITKAVVCFAGKDFLLLNDFSNWYPALGLLMILFNLSWWVNTGKVNFKIILIQRIIYCSVSLLIILADYLIHHSLTFQIAVISQVAGYGVSALFAFFVNRFSFHKKYLSLKMIKHFLGYGKFTMGTMLGSSLLRNADTFMIAAFMNSSAVAVYTLAQKIIEVFEVMLRSVAATFLPVLQNLRNDTASFSQLLIGRMAVLIAMFIPAALLVFIFSDNVIQLISGSDQYNLSAIILKVFMLYVLLLPVDRFLGVALEACHLPKLNFIKTVMLITVNIGGNYIALHFYHSLIGVAAVSSIALSTGIVAGFYFLNKSGAAKFSMSNIQQSLLKLKLQ
nr:oligosaccharide flippase family protein [Bacteroidota bacterium]